MLKIRNWTYRTLLWLTFGSAIALFLSYASVHIPPENFWPAAFFGLAYPVILLINFLLLLLWTVKLKKAAFIPLIAILLGFNHLNNTLSILPQGKKWSRDTQSDVLKILSYNVRAFNLYQWLNDPDTNKGILNFIRSEHPDVICLQEFYTGKDSRNDQGAITRLFSGTPFHHIHYVHKNKQNNGYGIATFSRYPVVGSGIIEFENSRNICIYTDIAYKADTIRVYNNHLQSVQFRQSNYALIDSLKFPSEEKQVRELKEISSRLKRAFINRGKQAKIVSAHIGKSPHPVIVCGDFNDTPVSYTYHRMKRGLSDAYVKAGKGTGNTYLGRISFRIDYILYSDDFKAIEFEKVEAQLSDHYPIMSRLRF
jgi:endonuclease/exonuclease/phosphatase (EEP) superfamily protein YafD